MPAAILLGSDHDQLGEISTRAVGPTHAIGISRGRFPKGYPHVDPNEDAALAFCDGPTTVLAAADGHRGFDAAHAAISAIADSVNADTDTPTDVSLAGLLAKAVEAVRDAIPLLDPPRNSSETALTVAAIRDGTVATATLGDTGCYIVTRRRAIRIGSPADFLTASTDPQAVEATTSRISPGSAVILTTDGFLDFVGDPKRVLRAAASLEPSEAVAELISAAFAGGAGDNIAIAFARMP